MAVTEILPLGYGLSMVQNQVYAVPAKVGRIHALAILEISPDGVTFDSLTASDTVGADVGSGFIRSTSANNVCVFKPY